MSYCINPQCDSRVNPCNLENCQFCGTPLLINGKYRLLQPLRSLRSDSYTEVFEIVDEKGTRISKPGTHKVMKVLNSNDSKLAELLEREALVLQLLNHPGIPKCDVYDGYFSFKLEGKRSDLHCLVLEKIEGQTLEWWLKSNKRLSQVLALNWLRQIFEILNTVHKAGFFHRDIKPSNILLKPDGQLVLIDFGGVRDVSQTYLAKVSSGLSSTGSGFFDVTVVRTACYAPLEQINGKAIPQSDFYAIGRTLAYLMTGIPLINLPEDRKTGRLLWRDKAPQIEKPLADFIDDLMAPFPGHRPPNTLVILQYLDKEKGRLQFLLKLWRVITSVQFQASAVVLSSLFVFGSYKILTIWKSNRYLDQASREQREDNPKAARRNFEMAIKNNFNNEEAHHGLALACESLRDFQCAFSEYNEAMRLNRTSWETHYALGNLYEERGNYDLAVEEYNTAIHLGKSLAVDAV